MENIFSLVQGDQGDFFGAGSPKRKPSLLQELLCIRTPFHISFLSRHCDGQACFFHPSTYPQSLLSTQEGHVFNQRLK